MKAHEAKKQIWKILPAPNSRNSESAGWRANHLVILAYCYKLHRSDYSNWAMKKRHKMHIKVVSENFSLLQTSFCVISLLQRNEKKIIMVHEPTSIFTKKESWWTFEKKTFFSITLSLIIFHYRPVL